MASLRKIKKRVGISLLHLKTNVYDTIGSVQFLHWCLTILKLLQFKNLKSPLVFAHPNDNNFIIIVVIMAKLLN